MKELEEIFTVDNSSKASKSGKDTAKTGSLTTLLDITRANNVGTLIPDCLYFHHSHHCNTAIMLARIKLSKSEIRQALLEVDDNRLSTDDLRSISRQLPTQEEINRIRDFGDLRTLSKADQYFGEVCMHWRAGDDLNTSPDNAYPEAIGETGMRYISKKA
jgi:diaphanous 1